MKRFLAAALLLTVPAFAAPVVIDRIEASVNTSLILLSDVGQFRKTVGLRSQLDPLFAGTPVAAHGAKAPTEEITEFLIDERLVSQHFPVTDTEVDQEINSIIANNRISRSQLKATLKTQGYTFDQYFDLIRSSAAKRNLIDREIRTRVAIADDDVRNYFYNHYSRKSSTPLIYKMKLIVISVSNYKTHAAAKATADRALQAIRGGESFEEVAKRVSDDPSGATGGELPALSGDQINPAIRNQVKKMKTGEVSSVFGSADSAYFLLKLVGMTTGDSSQYDKMKEEIRGQLTAAEYQRQIALWLERQRQTAHIHQVGSP